MTTAAVPELVLETLLGGVFVHYTIAGRRTFYSTDFESERGANFGQFSFLACGMAVTWWVALHVAIRPVNGVISATLLAAALSLYEWARQTIWGRRFGLGLGDQIPEALCEQGPYRLMRHPIYLSYMLTFAAIVIALPHWLTEASFVLNTVLFAYMAFDDERRLLASALASDYAAYRERTGMFWPKFGRMSPGR